MIKRSLVTLPWIQISDWEVKQNDWTRTREVLQYHQVNNSVNLPMSMTFFELFFFIDIMLEPYQYDDQH